MVKIRKATSDDIDVLFELILKIAAYHNQEQYVNTDEEKLLNDGFGTNPRYGALIAEVNGKSVGYLSYTWNYSIWTGGEYMNMDDLFVLEDQRSQKIGLQLMEYAKNMCQEKGMELIRWEVEKDNTRAIQFYKDLGAEINVKGIFRWKLTS
ncbi:N-acetyltransferase family protein [Flagellimonas sp. 2504JD4-2]